MKTDRFIVGSFQTNCYIVRADEEATDCLIIDTGLDSRELIDFVTQNALHPTAVILTHGHADHIGGLAALRERFGDLKVYVHKLDAKMLTDPNANLSTLAGVIVSAKPADVLLSEGDVVEEAGVRLEVLHTPGHTSGGICLYARDAGVVFAGDTLFADSVGRADFPGGDMDQLIQSIKTKLFVLPDETTVCPGHAMRTTIGREKRSNPFVT